MQKGFSPLIVIAGVLGLGIGVVALGASKKSSQKTEFSALPVATSIALKRTILPTTSPKAKKVNDLVISPNT